MFFLVHPSSRYRVQAYSISAVVKIAIASLFTYVPTKISSGRNMTIAFIIQRRASGNSLFVIIGTRAAVAVVNTTPVNLAAQISAILEVENRLTIFMNRADII